MAEYLKLNFMNYNFRLLAKIFIFNAVSVLFYFIYLFIFCGSIPSTISQIS